MKIQINREEGMYYIETTICKQDIYGEGKTVVTAMKDLIKELKFIQKECLKDKSGENIVGGKKFVDIILKLKF